MTARVQFWDRGRTPVVMLGFDDPAEKAELDVAFPTIPGGAVARATNGETWEYMGTAKIVTHGDAAARWTHQFRHRSHPATGRRMDVNILCSGAFAAQLDTAAMAERVR